MSTKVAVARATAETLAPAVQRAAEIALRGLPADALATKAGVDKVVEQTAAVVINQTNQEPWYQSRTTLSQILTFVVMLAGLLGYTIDPEYQKQILALVLAVGGLVNPAITLYSRWLAKKPLGA